MWYEKIQALFGVFNGCCSQSIWVSVPSFLIEKTGFRHETDKLYNDLAPYGLLQFTRSGRIAVTKSKMGISEILNTYKNQKKK